ncbi:MAG: hypothetical protein FWG59_03375 [Betaproteobacteria bacterium]|nr:hypothetical protein [Betaproteobacteria bacterium]
MNLHWLLLNEGPMFRKEIRDAVKRSEEAEERIRELKYTVELQKEKIEQLEKQDGFLKTAVLGAGTAARSSHIDTDR